MISKERLEELIEQGATIYFVYNGNVDEKEGIYKDDFILNETYVSIYWTTRSHQVKYENLFETKEEAIWQKEFGCIERTERFEPLYYDNIDQNYCYEYRFSTKNNHEYTIRVSGKDIILFWTNCNYKEYFKNTKEEYNKLIGRCAKMFLEGDYAN